MIRACRIGHATFETPDLDKLMEYYTSVIGLAPVLRETDRAFLATRTGQLAIELRRSEHPKCAKLSFEVAPDEDFNDMARRLSALGIKSEVRQDVAPGTPKVLAFEDPKGTIIELFNEWQPAALNHPCAGIAPLKLGHVAFLVPEPRPISDFYARVLGFRVSDWIDDFFVFMRCNADHHTVNFIRGTSIGVHHFAFELKDFAHLQNACDLFGQREIPILWGPLRLGPGHNVAVYHRNPDNQIVELYAELDQMKDEALGYWEPRPWHRDRPQRPKVWPRVGSESIWGVPPAPDFPRTTRQS
jgi:catechol 2,3-dioxygenase-like lactoylglutathione lyase family enzyme